MLKLNENRKKVTMYKTFPTHTKDEYTSHCSFKSSKCIKNAHTYSFVYIKDWPRSSKIDVIRKKIQQN